MMKDDRITLDDTPNRIKQYLDEIEEQLRGCKSGKTTGTGAVRANMDTARNRASTRISRCAHVFLAS